MPKTCSIEGCDRPAKTRGWCGLHYMRWFKHGDPLTLKKGGKPHNRADGSCIVEGCDKPPPYVKGMCSMHYVRQWKYGDPETVQPHGGGRPALAKQCRIVGCDNPRPYTQGLCRPHYRLLIKYGDPLWEPPPKPPCDVDGCERDVYARGHCHMHYYRLMQLGDAGEVAPRRADAGVGHITAEGYRKVTVNGRKILEHRHVMEQVIGRPLEEEESVHHINGIRTDNRPENLELWVGMHGKGQRVEDLVRFVVTNYRDEVLKELHMPRAALAALVDAVDVVQQSYDDEGGEYVASWAMEMLAAARAGLP